MSVNLSNKVKAVNRVFAQVDAHTKRFRTQSNISCPAGCGKCCTKTNIEATVLEFIPSAYAHFKAGADAELEEKLERSNDGMCIFYNPFLSEGSCSNYQNRGLICRLFGYSVNMAKNNEKKLVTCKIIKDSFGMENMSKALNKAPELSAYYMKLFGIDPLLSVNYLPINQAIKKAFEIVGMHFQYRRKRA